MNDQKFREDLKELCNKYNLVDCAFCGTNKTDDKYFAEISVEQDLDFKTIDSGMRTALNVGRLWQFARETCRHILDQFEKKW